MRFGVVVFSVMLLSGCLGTPELPLLSDVELAEDTAVTGLVAPDTPAPETVLEELQSVENVPEVPAVEVVPEKPRRGLAALFGRRKARQEQADIAAIPDAAPVDVDAVSDAPAADTKAADIPVSEVADAQAKVVPETDEPVLVAAAQPQEKSRPARKGLFGPRRAKSDQAPKIDPNVLLPFGQIGSACGIRGKALGKEVDKFPARGKGYKLYDTDPATTGPRTHYITGFKDGCPRRFTASLALLDSPVLHEQLLSAEGDKGQHATSADIAFQKVRAKVCRTGRGKACPEKHIAKMEKNMAFVTTYERFGGAARWTEILLHNGTIKANALQE